MADNALHRELKREQHEHNSKNGSKLRFTGTVSCSYFTSYACRVTMV